MQWLFRALMIVLAALLLWGGPAAARLPPNVSETVKPEKPAHALRYAQRGGAAFKAKPQRQAQRLSRGAPPRLKVARAARNLSRASVNRKAPGARAHRLTNTAAARRAQTHSQRRGVFLAGRGHPALAVTPRAPAVATSAARPAPTIARAGTRTPAAGNTRIAANGVSGKGKAVNDNRPAGVTARFNTAARTTALRQTRRGAGAAPKAEQVRVAGTGRNVAVLVTTSRNSGGIGPRAKHEAMANKAGRHALHRLRFHANAKKGLVANKNVPLKFGGNGLIYGPSAKGALARLEASATGKTLSTELKGNTNPIGRGQWPVVATQKLAEAAKTGRQVRFDLTHMKDMNNLLRNRGEHAAKTTSQELRYIRDNWRTFQVKPKFYRGGIEVPPPWK